MVARGKQCPLRPTIAPHKACSADIYRRIKRRVGRSLKRVYCKRILVGTGKQTAHKLSRTQSGVLALKEFQNLCVDKIVLVATDNTTVVAYINKEGGMRSGPLCPTVENLNLVFPATSDTKSLTHPRPLKCDSREAIQTGSNHPDRVVPLPEVFHQIYNQWHRPQIDLFATRFNHKLPQFVSPVPDSLAVAVDALTLPWEELDAY